MKESVLEALITAGGWVSGQRISREVGKSRAAVWQWIEELRREGYVIDAAPRRGYRLTSRPDRLFPAELAPYLETAFVGRVVEYRASVGSTNDVAKSMAKRGAPEGLVVVAEEQRSGKGRRGRSWSSPFGLGVWSSTVLRPQVSPYDAPKMALVAALATVRAIESATPLTAGIKWPNDVLVAGKKVCGILVEMDAEIDMVRHLIVGIGINANMRLEDIPPEARPRATSLRQELGAHVDRRAILGSLLNHLEQLYVRWRSESFTTLLAEVRARTETLGRAVTVIEGSGTWGGEALDIGDDGALLVRDDDGNTRSVYAAEVSVR